MEISKVKLTNFKPFYGETELDLSVNPEQNLVLIGGKNGQGKTSLLVGLVWCLYGKGIADVDKVFRKEIKSGNYEKFLMSSLNLKARESGEVSFSVGIEFTRVELSDALTSDTFNLSTVTLIRSYNTATYDEQFTILIDGKENQLVSEEEHKPIFVDTFLVPKDAAKFFFFDAEKISEIAELSVKEQGRVMNDALGKILGLGKYESLIQDLQVYRDALKTKNAQQSTLFRQIETYNNQITLNTNKIEELENKFSEKEEEINLLDSKIKELNTFLAQSGAKNLNLNVGELERTKSNAEQAKAKLAERLHEISEFLPFAIAAGKFTELVEHIQSEETLQRKSAAKKEVQEQAEEFLESLFNRPPYPQEDMTMKQKSFYYTKAEELFGNLYLGESDGESLLSFTHDLGKGATDYIFDTYANLQRQSDQLFQGVFNDYIRIKNDLNDVQRDLNRARAHAEDDNILDWKENLRTAQQNRDQAIQEKGSLSNDLIRLQEETKTTENRKNNLLNQVEVSKQDQGKIDEVNRYITSLKQFVQAQKIAKCHSLEKNILHEMHRIMHKKDFLDEVRVKILPDGDGLEVAILKNKEDVPLPSSGEKQIFISCLLKAILTEAIVDLPVFIDTPLGRLDRQHKDNFVKDYYPYLASQVVILSTDEEITQRRKHEIEQFVSHAFLLVNQNNQTTILNEYF